MKLKTDTNNYKKAAIYGAISGLACLFISILAFLVLILINSITTGGSYNIYKDLGLSIVIYLLGGFALFGWAAALIGAASSVFFHFLRLKFKIFK